jgi:hypothetical protein
MIALPAGVKVWLAAGATDMRNGFDGLEALVQMQLAEDPFSGQLFDRLTSASLARLDAPDPDPANFGDHFHFSTSRLALFRPSPRAETKLCDSARRS